MRLTKKIFSATISVAAALTAQPNKAKAAEIKEYIQKGASTSFTVGALPELLLLAAASGSKQHHCSKNLSNPYKKFCNEKNFNFLPFLHSLDAN